MSFSVSFKIFCDLCERLQKAKKHAEKDTLLSSFLKRYKEKNQLELHDTNDKPSVYPALRLLIPEFEKERGPYGLKETALAKLFINALCLDPQSANKLSNFKAGLNVRKDDDFAGVAFWVIKRSCPEKSTLTINDVNTFLDTLAKHHAEHTLTREVQRTLYKMTKTTTAFEMKWIIRIILKDMKLGMGNNRILKIFHEDAPNMYDTCMDLSKVCEALNDSQKRLHELEISVFTPFRPMLCEKCDSTIFDNEVTDQRLFYVENKFDGERFQLHMKDGQFKYYSKNGYDYTNTYGDTYNSDGLITPYLKDMFKDVSSVILDGEMMGWNKGTKNFGSKGMKFDVKNLRNDSVHRPCYCVFDIVLYNDEVLTNKPLQERLKILNRLITDIDGVIMKSRIVETNTKNALLNELNKSHDKKDEGVCFKDPESIYKPNDRKSGWWKMKLEYFDGLMTELDIVIIGGYYGEGRRRGLISSFLLAVAQDPENAGDSPSEFLSFAKVANGFTIEELDKLVNKLKNHWKPVDKKVLPKGILWKKEKPDLWIEPRNSIILQVRASELAKTTEFQTEYTLRFPRVEEIRYDKPWYSCMTKSELDHLTSTKKPIQKLSDRHITINDIDPPKKRRRKNNAIIIPTLKDGQQKTNLFQDKEICIFTGNDQHTIENLEIMVLENGGSITKLPSKSTYCIVVGNVTTAVHIIKKNHPVDIVTVEWFLKAIDHNNEDLLEWKPCDLLNMSKRTKERLAQSYDPYGDSFTEEISRDELDRIFTKMDQNDDYMNLIPEEMTTFDQSLNFQNPLGLFRMCFAYFDNDYEAFSEELDRAQIEFRFYGGKVCETIEDYTTHIIISESRQNRKNQVKEKFPNMNYDDVKFINVRWIFESISEETRLDESNFLICDT